MALPRQSGPMIRFALLPMVALPLVALGCSESHSGARDEGFSDAGPRVDAEMRGDAPPDAYRGAEGGCRPPSRWVGSSPTTLDTYTDAVEDFSTPTRHPVRLLADGSGVITAVWAEGDFGAVHALHAQTLDRAGVGIGVPRTLTLESSVAFRTEDVAATDTGFVVVTCTWLASEDAMQRVAVTLDNQWNPLGRRALSPLGTCDPIAMRSPARTPLFSQRSPPRGGPP